MTPYKLKQAPSSRTFPKKEPLPGRLPRTPRRLLWRPRGELQATEFRHQKEPERDERHERRLLIETGIFPK